MVQGIGRYLQRYYMFSFAMVILSLAGAIHYYWENGLMDGHQSALTYESSVWLEDLQKNNYDKKIRTDLSSSRVRKAYQYFDKLKVKVSDLNRVRPLDEFYSPVRQNTQKMNKHFQKLVSYPEVSSIFKIFNRKMTKFRKFVTDNRWRTLMRMSNRIMVKVEKLNRFTMADLKPINRSIVQDINIMKTVTNNSVLSSSDKTLINKRLDALKIEMDMLSRFLNSQSKGLKDFKAYVNSYKSWLEKVGPEISLAKIELEQKNKVFTFILAAITLLALALLVIGLFVNRGNEKDTQDKVEKNIAQFVNDYLVPSQFTLEMGSPAFRKEMKNLHGYFQKRMSFGSIFQETLPFSAILLDSNLKVIWANPQFSKEWEIEQTMVEEETLTWDFIYRFTNLGDTDPVIDAMQTDIAGIFQIQVKTKSGSKPMPYEMYVAPVEHSYQKRVMVFFYPLNSLEETLNHQTQSLVSPISKTLDALMNREFSNSFAERAQEEFVNTGIDHLFDKFQGLHETMNIERNHFIDQIQRQDDEIESLRSELSTHEQIATELNELQKTYEKTFLSLKEQLVKFIGHDQMSFENTKTIINEVAKFDSDVHNMMDLTNELLSGLMNYDQSFESLGKVRQELKSLSKGLSDSRLKLSQTIDQAMVFSRSSKIDPAKVEQALNKVKSDAKTLDQSLLQIAAAMKSFDILYSKMEILMDKTSVTDFDQKFIDLKENKQIFEKRYAQLTTEHKELFNENYQIQEQLVSGLRHLYHVSSDKKKYFKELEA